MARDIESLVLRMSADLRRFEKEMAKANSVTDRELSKAERRALQGQRNLAKTMETAGRDMVSALRNSLSAIAPTLAAAFSAQAVIQYADAWTSGRNALAAAGVATADLATRQSELVDIANESRTGAAETVALYQRLSIATAELGLSQKDTLRLTELLNKSFASGGLSTQEAASAALQLSQALASGTLQGDELRSIRENAPLVAKAIADSMGVGIGALKGLGAEGKITANVIVQALFGASEQINTTFANTEITVGQALTRLNNNLGRFVGQADDGLSATDRLAQGIVAMADNLDVVAQVVGAVATLIGTRYVLALTASTSAMVANGLAAVRLAAFQTAMTASLTGTTSATIVATGAMARFNAMLLANPIGAVVLATAALSAGIIYLGSRLEITGQAARDVTAANTALKAATDAYAEAANAAAVATGEESRVAQANAQAKRDQAVAIRDAAQAKLADAAATVAQIQAEAQRQLDLERRAPIRGDRPGSVRTIGREDRQRLADAQKSASETTAAIAAANAAIAQADAALKARPARASGAGPSTPRGGGGGGGAEQAARARDALALEEAIARARASGDGAAIKAAEERQRLAQLTQQYEAAGYSDANARATEHLALINQATLRAEDLAGWIKQSDEFWEQIGDNTERAAASEQLLTDQTRDRLGFEAEIARLTGNEVAIRNAERRLFIEERALEIIRLKLAATKEEAELMAGAEFSALDNAERSGDLRDEFRQSFSEGIRAAIEGDVGGFMENLADRFTDRMLDNLADDLFDLLSSAAKGFSGGQGGGGGGFISAIASLFSGQRATGGGVVRGQSYLVGERRPEVFTAPASGTIIPNVNAAMARAQSAGGPVATIQPIVFDLSGAVMTEDLIAMMNQIGAKAQIGAVRQSTDIVRRSAGAMQQRQRRLGTA